MTDKEKDLILDAWAKMQVVCALSDPTASEEHFPNKVESLFAKTKEVFILLDKVLRHRDEE